ncbi:MAG: hypothetical protein FJ291_03840 [Planctomycetes bacterium]|nr:hypothetical protein [Planctomycetota bacterium]
MRRDEAIDAIRAVRHQISAEHGHDTRRLIRYYQEMEKDYADRMLREPPAPRPARTPRTRKTAVSR